MGLKSDIQLFYFSFRKHRSCRQLHSPDGSGFEPMTSVFLVERNYHETKPFRANNSLAAETKSGLSFLLFLSSLKFPGRNKNNFFFVTWAWISNCPVSSSWSLHLTYTLSLSHSPLSLSHTPTLWSIHALFTTLTHLWWPIHAIFTTCTHTVNHSRTHIHHALMHVHALTHASILDTHLWRDRHELLSEEPGRVHRSGRQTDAKSKF